MKDNVLYVKKNDWTALQFVVLGVFLYILKYLQIAVIGPFSHFYPSFVLKSCLAASSSSGSPCL